MSKEFTKEDLNIIKCASTDKTRPAITGVYIERYGETEDGEERSDVGVELVVTDGYKLIAKRIEGATIPDSLNSKILAPEFVKNAIKVLGRGKLYLEEDNTTGGVVVSAKMVTSNTITSMPVQLIDQEYIDYKKLLTVPEGEIRTVIVARFNALLLRQALEQFASKGMDDIEIEINTGNYPMAIRSSASTGEEMALVTALVMPMTGGTK